MSAGNSNPEMPDWAATPPKGCASGSAKFRGDAQFAFDGASSAARGELAKSIKVQLMELYKRYRSEGEVGGADFTEEKSEQARKELVDMPLSGTLVTKKTVLNGFAWSEVCMDPKVAEGYIQNMKTLGEAQRRALNNRAKEMFSELDDAVAKSRGSN